MKLRNKKTGEVITLKDEGEIALMKSVESSLPNGLSLWEEVKEPLIKDGKIRKAVRAWAEALGTYEVRYNSCAEYSEGRFEAEMGMADIDFGRVLELEDGDYTIAELCGEEE